jgi:hypothetical protein
MNVGGRVHAHLKLVADAFSVYIGIHAADADVVTPEDLEGICGTAFVVFEG